MKRAILILTAAVLTTSLFSCKNQTVSNVTNVDAVAGGTSDYAYEGKTVTHTLTSVIDEFDHSKETKLENDAPRVSFVIPDSWRGEGTAYQSYDKRISGYTRTFEIYSLYRVNEGYIMSGDLISLCRFDKIFSKKMISGLSMSAGATETGYEYTAFTTENTQTYFMIAFVKVSPDLILPFSIVLPDDGKTTAQRCLNSILYTENASSVSTVSQTEP